MRYLLLLLLPLVANAGEIVSVEGMATMTKVFGEDVSTHYKDTGKNLTLSLEGKVNLSNDIRLISGLEIADKPLHSDYMGQMHYLYLQDDFTDRWSFRAGRVRHTFGMYPESDSLYKPFRIPVRPQSIYRPAFEALGSSTDGVQISHIGEVINAKLTLGRMVVDSSDELMGVYYQYPAGRFDTDKSTSTVLNLSTHCIPKIEGRVDVFYWDYKFVPSPTDPYQLLAGTDRQTTLATIISGRYYTDYDLDFIAEWIDTQGGGNTWHKFTQTFVKIRAQGWSIGAIKTMQDWQSGVYIDRFDVVDDKSQLMAMGNPKLRLYTTSYNLYTTYRFDRQLYASAQYINREGSATENVSNAGNLKGESVLLKVIKYF